ncbi:hypothetical protein LCGC14_2098460 [marine sediment metagenome]|uniref:Uncharacterized protein n=1 Tax=marine sediment metagenome TaxID=412755 RepID=A0A0F9EAV5_9ZZZZ
MDDCKKKGLTGDVAGQLTELTENLGGLEKAIDQLNNVTEPIRRRSSPENTNQNDTPEKPLVPIAVEIYVLSMTVCRLRDQIRGICDEISI